MIVQVYSFIMFLPSKIDIFIIFSYIVNIYSGLATHLPISLPMIHSTLDLGQFSFSLKDIHIFIHHWVKNSC